MTNKDNIIVNLNAKDFVIIALISAFVIVFYFLINFNLEEQHRDLATFIIAFSTTFVIFVLCMKIAHEKRFEKQIDNSFIFLGLSFVFISLGEITYWLLDNGGYETYPSIADVFFFMQYPMLMLFCLKICQILVQKQDRLRFILTVISITAVITAVYLVIALPHSNGFDFDFWYGILFIVVSSVTLGMTVFLVSITKGGMINRVWILIFVGLLLNTTGDVWYYYLELTEAYDLIHPVNILWYAAYFIMIYAVYRQRGISLVKQ